MAKYTELFAEYLESGGALPAAFDQIEGFGDLFTAHFIDCEIGFETEELFAIKLEERAELVIPAYAKKLALVEDEFGDFSAPVKIRTHTSSNTHTFEAGEKRTKSTNLPQNMTSAAPNAVGVNESYVDNDTVEDSGSDREEGFTPDESIRRLEFVQRLEGQTLMIKRQCLDEFESLFMRVF